MPADDPGGTVAYQSVYTKRILSAQFSSDKVRKPENRVKVKRKSNRKPGTTSPV